MIIFPAIDLRKGKVVRLQQGRAEAETKFADDPAQVAVRWQEEGAEWLHVVNLDGAFGDDASANLRELARILESVSIPVQFGGGLRDMERIHKAIALGVQRVVLGTAAVEDSELVTGAVAQFGADRVAVGVDVRNGMAAVRGWREQAQISALEVARRVKDGGIARVIYTDIARDGMMRGIDVDAIARFARAAGLSVIASGGVSNMGDIKALRGHGEIEGAIVGQALYTGAVDLGEAIRAGKENHPVS